MARRIAKGKRSEGAAGKSARREKALVVEGFGPYLRACRERRFKEDPSFSVRGLAARIGVEPSYLSKVERGIEAPPSEERLAQLAAALGEDGDTFLALAGRVSSDLRRVILRRPALFAKLIRELKDLPDHALLRIAREVRDGNW